jgi:hypothetical protein
MITSTAPASMLNVMLFTHVHVHLLEEIRMAREKQDESLRARDRVMVGLIPRRR